MNSFSTKDEVFREVQRFRQWWIWLVITTLLCIIGWAIVQQLILDIPWGHHPAPDTGILIIALLVVLIIALFVFTYLETCIDAEGIHYRYFPFYPRYRTIKWDEIESAGMRDHSPMGEFGGWGIRGTGKRRALTVSGKCGLQIVLKNGKQLYIGTQKPDEMREFLTRSGKINK